MCGFVYSAFTEYLLLENYSFSAGVGSAGASSAVSSITLWALSATILSLIFLVSAKMSSVFSLMVAAFVTLSLARSVAVVACVYEHFAVLPAKQHAAGK